jgi:hypothetical protein
MWKPGPDVRISPATKTYDRTNRAACNSKRDRRSSDRNVSANSPDIHGGTDRNARAHSNANSSF